MVLYSIWAARGVRLHNAVKVQGQVLLGAGCRVGANVVFRGRVCVGPGCVIEDEAHLADCVLHAKVRVGTRVKLETCLVGEGARLGADAHVGPDQVVANHSVLGPYSRQGLGLLPSEEL